MTIDEAIQELEDEHNDHAEDEDTPLHGAIRLGIEALTRFKTLRSTGRVPQPDHLSSETD